MNDPNISFGSIVKERRHYRDLTQAELARRVGCATITIRKIEADQLRPSTQIAERLAMALGVPLDERANFVRLARTSILATPEPSPLPTPPPMPEEIGDEDLSGRAIRGYELGEKIGVGGFGAVYRATQPLVEREVAIKIILPQYADHPEFIRRFESEAQLVARLEHPHIVPLYDYWREPGVAYLVMRLLRGGSMYQLLQKGPLPLPTAVALLQQIGTALDTAHRMGVIHRDIKPANILLDEDGNGYLADFGIAKNLGNPQEGDITQMGGLVGSPAYISPEQIRAEPVLPQADIYRMGIMLFEMLAGSKPFIGPTPIDFIQQHLNDPLPLLTRLPQATGLPPAIDDIIGRATAKSANDRYPDVREFLGDLAHLGQSGITIDTMPLPPAIDWAQLSNPYKGLRPFEEADAAHFFGRDTFVQELLSKMAEINDLARFLAVVGPSGSGKSSAVKAGLLPALRRGGLPGSEKWFVAEMTPGANPYDELISALAQVAIQPISPAMADSLKNNTRGLLQLIQQLLPTDPAVQLVLLIDQFEELFTLTTDEAVRVHFLENIITAVLSPISRLRIIVTMRADFTDRPLRYVDFGDLMRQRTEFILPLSPDELEQAIEQPVKQLGMYLEPGLTTRIVSDVGDEPGALPLLQYALTELFERQEEGQLTRSAYEASGGVLGALARRADEIYTSLDGNGRSFTRQLFLRLISLGEGVEDTRRRVCLSELEALNLDAATNTQQDLNAVTNLYGKFRLLTFDRDPLTREPTVEVAHEALLREWGRLRQWLDESRDDIRLQRRLATAVDEWEQANRDAGFLLLGSRLDLFADWVSQSPVALTHSEEQFLAASQARQTEIEAERAAQQQRELAIAQQMAETERQRAEEQAQSVRRLRIGAVVLAGISLVTIVLAVLAFNARTTAQREATVNRSLRLADQATELDEAGNVDGALALALTAVDIEDPPPETISDLAEVASGMGTRAVLTGHNGAVKAGAFSPDGQQAISGGCGQLAASQPTAVGDCTQGELILWDLSTMTETTRWSGHDNWITALAWSPDGSVILSGDENGELMMWDAANQTEIAHWSAHNGRIYAIVLNPDGTLAATAGKDGEVVLLDVSNRQIAQRLQGHDGAVLALDFSPDGTQLVSGSADATMMLWDLQTGMALQQFVGHASGVNGVAFTPDGSAILSSGDLSLRLWETATGAELQVRESGDTPSGLVLSSNGRTVLHTVGHIVYTWDLQAWNAAHRKLFGHDGEIEDIALTLDGKLALTAGDDGLVRIWNLQGADNLWQIVIGRSATGVAVSPDGTQLAIGGWGQAGILWDVPSSSPTVELTGGKGIIAPGGIDFSADGRWVIAGSGDYDQSTEAGSVLVWDAKTGDVQCDLQGITRRPRTVAFSPKNGYALSGSQGEDGLDELILWDVNTCQLVRRFDTQQDTTGIDFSADGQLAVTASAFSGNATLWNVNTGEAVQVYPLPDEVFLDVAFGADDETVLTAAISGLIVEWDRETGVELQRYWGHDGGVWSVEVSPDNRYMVSSDDTGTVILWDLVSGTELRRHHAHNGLSFQAAFSPDGQTVYSVSADQTLAIWQIGDPSLPALLEWINVNRYVRDLTCEEREQYGIAPLCP